MRQQGLRALALFCTLYAVLHCIVPQCPLVTCCIVVLFSSTLSSHHHKARMAAHNMAEDDPLACFLQFCFRRIKEEERRGASVYDLVRLPQHSIIYEHHFPKYWLYYEGVRLYRKVGKEASDIGQIYKALAEGAGEKSVVAVFLCSSKEVGLQARYLTKQTLHCFLHERVLRSERGVLQKYTPPRGSYAESIKVQWTPHLASITRYVNEHLITDDSRPIFDTHAVFKQVLGHVTQASVAPLISDICLSVCSRIVSDFEATYDKARIKHIVFFLQPVSNGPTEVILLFCSSCTSQDRQEKWVPDPLHRETDGAVMSLRWAPLAERYTFFRKRVLGHNGVKPVVPGNSKEDRQVLTFSMLHDEVLRREGVMRARRRASDDMGAENHPMTLGQLACNMLAKGCEEEGVTDVLRILSQIVTGTQNAAVSVALLVVAITIREDAAFTAPLQHINAKRRKGPATPATPPAMHLTFSKPPPFTAAPSKLAKAIKRDYSEHRVFSFCRLMASTGHLEGRVLSKKGKAISRRHAKIKDAMRKDDTVYSQR